MIETREVDVELRWRAAPLALALASCAAAALALAVIAVRWQLIAFAAPLLGVLASTPWQPPAPKFRVRARPAAQRCFETEQTQLTLESTTEPAGAAGQLTALADAEMRLEALEDSGVGR
ncbi:hypothetical protein [Mycobacterium talmoniae]|uniref:Uncharacterized protein n=1 Tax=Mycobacterium talmoniae TaxID=1858794 RepID=A0A1S1MHP7_9MYCO|nr:hypothetical protein [Mycobacterium talmoniae]OHU82802.1 hypothetical protein BKN37_26870 [Mycobacterium talmoniae]